MKDKKLILNKFYQDIISLGYFPNEKRLAFKMEQLFSGVDFEDKRVLDIGAGIGLTSFFAAANGAKEVISLEPEFDGSHNKMQLGFKNISDKLEFKNVHLKNDTLQQYQNKFPFDVIILINSINHIDEATCGVLHEEKNAQNNYKNIFKKLYDMTNNDGIIIITDCSRINFWPLVTKKNPFARSITWDIHQSPYLWLKLLKEVGFKFHKLSWSTPNRLGKIGRFFFGNKYLSFFYTSHFNLYVTK